MMKEFKSTPVEVSDDALSRSLDALKQLITKIDDEDGGNDILGNNDDRKMTISLSVLLALPSEGGLRSYPVRLIHPFYNKRRVCVIVQDPLKEWKTIIRNDPVPAVVKTTSVGKLLKMQEDHKWKARFSHEYDLFLADARAAHMLPAILGSNFLNTNNKFPVPIAMSRKSFTKKVRNALSCTFFRLPRGKDLSVPIGTASMSLKELTSNAKRVLARLSKFFVKNSDKCSNRIDRVCLRCPAVRKFPSIPIYYHSDLKNSFLNDTFGIAASKHSKNGETDSVEQPTESEFPEKVHERKMNSVEQVVSEKADKKKKGNVEQVDKEKADKKNKANVEQVDDRKRKKSKIVKSGDKTQSTKSVKKTKVAAQ